MNIRRHSLRLASRYAVIAATASEAMKLGISQRMSDRNQHPDMVHIGEKMTQNEVADRFKEIFREIFDLRGDGQKEYAHQEDNAFRNFENIGSYLGISREKVLLTYMIKHIDGIVAYVNGHTSQREGVEGRINDAIVYLMLLRCMVDDNQIEELKDVIT